MMTHELAQEILEEASGAGKREPVATAITWACLAGIKSGLKHPLHIELWDWNGKLTEFWFREDGGAEFLVEPSEPQVLPLKFRISDLRATGILEATIDAKLVEGNIHWKIIEAGWTPAEGVA